MNTEHEYRELALQLAQQQVVAQYMAYWQDFRESERRKSPLLPVLWGHKGYAQNDEDGISHEIFRRIGIASRTFLEIGVGNGVQNNSLFWLKQGWRGAWVEAGADNAQFIRRAFSNVLATGDLHFQEKLVNAENINDLVVTAGLDGKEVDLLSIDIDGNDYYVFEGLSALDARVVIIEYNAKFPPPTRWRIPYSPEYVWDATDRFGASLQTMSDLFERRKYSLVACNVTGSNAFFVRNDLLMGKFPCIGEIDKLYQPARYFLTPGLFDHLGGAGKISARVDGIWE
jgi:hypothetical protein